MIETTDSSKLIIILLNNIYIQFKQIQIISKIHDIQIKEIFITIVIFLYNASMSCSISDFA